VLKTNIVERKNSLDVQWWDSS